METSMTKRHLRTLAGAAALSFLVLPAIDSTARAQTACEVDLTTATPAGKVTAEVTSIGFMAGVRWGDGVVELSDGTNRQFRVLGAKLIEPGAARDRKST